MPRIWRATLVASVIAVATSRAGAHKPITSPFTFSADVRPILQQRCVRCHAPGAVAPMSLTTHIDTMPWAESMRMELMSGHMPPWRVDRGGIRFRDSGGLTARELNVLLTWVTGGTPPGLPVDSDELASPQGWALGTPDAVLPLPRTTLAADEQERTVEFVVPADGATGRLRAVDLLPGTPAIVRSASIEVQAPEGKVAMQPDRVLSLWVPGDAAVPLSSSGLALPRGAKLLVRVRYRKTWEYERREMSDESQVGLYFAPPSTPPVQRVALAPGAVVTLPRSSHALAIYPHADLADAEVVVTATRPDGRRDELIAFHPRRGWARRYWFREPVALPRGTRLSVRIAPESRALLPPGFVAPPAARRDPSTARVFVNVIP